METKPKKRPGSIYNKRITVGEYAWRWLARKAPSLKPSTRQRYVDALRLICEALGEIRMADLTPGDVSDWFASLPSHLAASSCNGYLRVLRVMTKDAKADLRLVHWACDRVTTRQTDRYSDEDPNALSAIELINEMRGQRDCRQPEWLDWAVEHVARSGST